LPPSVISIPAARKTRPSTMSIRPSGILSVSREGASGRAAQPCRDINVPTFVTEVLCIQQASAFFGTYMSRNLEFLHFSAVPPAPGRADIQSATASVARLPAVAEPRPGRAAEPLTVQAGCPLGPPVSHRPKSSTCARGAVPAGSAPGGGRSTRAA
jgi:hypothetical protein